LGTTKPFSRKMRFEISNQVPLVKQTLGGLNANLSSIPLPASAMKRSTSGSNLNSAYAGAPYTHGRSQSGSRMSLAPGRPAQPIFTRSSSGANAGYDGAPMSAQRQAGSGGSALFGQSAARRSFMPQGAVTPGATRGLQTPGGPGMGMSMGNGMAPDTMQRRSSCYSARPSNGPGGASHQSFFSTAPVAAGVPVDPRRLRDPGVRGQMAQDLLDYFTRNNYEMETATTLTNKTLTSPTQKEFNGMFKWLYNRLDPAYRFQKNIDAEIPPLLKQLRYPFEKLITKSQITAVGGNNWHTFLGLLHWIMQLATMADSYASGKFDYACMEAGLDVSGDRIIFDFLSDAYKAWLSVDADADDDEADKIVQLHADRMADRFRAVNKDLLDDVEMLAAEKKALEDQISELERGHEHGKKLDDKLELIMGDIVKYEEWIAKVERKMKKSEERIQMLEDEMRKVDDDIEKVEKEKAEYQEAISQQGITVQDLDRMSSEIERLEKSKQATASRLEETRTRASQMESEASKKLEELERCVEAYNSLAYKIGLIPSTALNAKGQNYELAMRIGGSNTAAPSDFSRSQSQEPESRLLKDAATGYQAHELLNLDLRGMVKTNIISLRKEISERRNRALEDHIKDRSLLDGFIEAMDEKQAEVDSLGHRIRAAEDEHEKTKEMTQTQKMSLDAQIERMEKELAKLRQSLTESVQLMEQREINTNLE
jgi:kinetochore protein NDC80